MLEKLIKRLENLTYERSLTANREERARLTAEIENLRELIIKIMKK